MNINYTQYYLKWHKNTPSHRSEMARYYKYLLGPYLPKDAAGLVLDVGCGMGLTLDFLRGAGYTNLIGLDTDASQVKLAQENQLPAVCVENSISYLNEIQEKASCVLCLDVLEHVPKRNQIEFLKALFQALKSGGRLILTVPNANSPLASRWRYNDWTHEASFTEHSLDFVLFHAGFKKIRVAPAEFMRRPKLFYLPISGGRHWWAFCFFRLFRRLEMMAELGPQQGRKIPLSLNLLAIADKD